MEPSTDSTMSKTVIDPMGIPKVIPPLGPGLVATRPFLARSPTTDCKNFTLIPWLSPKVRTDIGPSALERARVSIMRRA